MRSSLLLAAALAACSIAPAQAGLGGHSASLPTEAKAMKATALAARTVTTPSSTYSRQELTLADGGKASEFIDASGQVFAVSWKSPTMPDLTTLLGSYRASLDKAQQNTSALGRAPRQINMKDGDCVLVSTGRLRSYEGFAYLSTQLPANFDIQELSK
jgi:hypothetical protein